MRMEEAFLQQDRKELKHITTETHTVYTPVLSDT